MTYYITSDTHFCHDKDFCYKPRGFSSIKEMNEGIIERWNSVVKPYDIVYHLGDICLNDSVKGAKCISKLNGRIVWFRGNHDTVNKIDYILRHCDNIQLWEGLNSSYSTVVKMNNMQCYLSHYPTLVANYDEKHFTQHTINFHGHTHQKQNFIFYDNPFIYHVGVDSHNCFPIPLEQAIDDVRQAYIKLNNGSYD